MNIAYTCKICHRPRIAQAEDCPSEWVLKLAPLLTCDPCADKRGKYVKAISAIASLCSQVEKLNHWKWTDGKKGEDEKNDRIKPLRSGLVVATKNYAAAVAKIQNLSAPVWMEDFVDQLIEMPDKVALILSVYRKGIKIAANDPREQPELRHATNDP